MKRENMAGKVIILFIVGLFPMIFAVLYNCFFDNEDYEVIVISVCTVMGGLLDIFVLHREYGISISEKNKINIKLLILVLLFAIFYLFLLPRNDQKLLYLTVTKLLVIMTKTNEKEKEIITAQSFDEQQLIITSFVAKSHGYYNKLRAVCQSRRKNYLSES